MGGNGYIGTVYQQRHQCVVNQRDDITPTGAKILYLISTTHNHHPPGNPYIDIDTNLMTLMRVLENARRLPNVEFNFVSSWFVYGHTDLMLAEDAVCNPQGFYSITKRTAEQLLIEYCGMHGMSWRIMRLCNVIGGHDHTSTANKNVLQQICQRLQQDQTIELANGGEFYRDYLHVQDVCDAMHWIMQHGDVNTIFNVGSGSPVLFRTVIDHARHCCHSASAVIHRPGIKVQNCMMDCGRLTTLGWHPRLTWQSAVADMITAQI